MYMVTARQVTNQYIYIVKYTYTYKCIHTFINGETTFIAGHISLNMAGVCLHKQNHITDS